ncbi:MAG: CtpF protein [Methylocystaceae bacterium]|nr:CtpF protein [Methylocystaceae bacterium]
MSSLENRDQMGQETLIAPIPRITLQAFCDTNATASAIQGAVQDRRMSKVHVKVQMGGIAGAIESFQSSPTPNVIVIETASQNEYLLEKLNELAELCDPGTKVLVIGQYNDISLYRELISRGVSDYLVVPLNVITFVKALSTIYSSTASAAIGRVIAVMGAKGGVGSSTLAHNLAWCFSNKLDLSAAIIDMDLPFGTAALNFNHDPSTGMTDAVFAEHVPDTNLIDKLLIKCTDKLNLFASYASLDRTYDIQEDGLDAIMDSLRTMVPNIILDIPHIWTGWSKRALMSADEVIIVAAPDLANLRNTKSLLDVLRVERRFDSSPRFVLNFTNMPKRPEISSEDFAHALDLEPQINIAFDPKLFGTAANNGQMLGEVDPKHPAAVSMMELASRICRRMEPKVVKKGLLDPILSKFMGRLAS